MTKKEIIDYVMETPQNTNPAILSQMLDELGGEGGGSMEPLIVNAINTSLSAYETDKTFGEIKEAYSKGVPVVMYFPNGEDMYSYKQLTYLSVDTVRFSGDIRFQNYDQLENWGINRDSLEELMSAHPSYSYD